MIVMSLQNIPLIIEDLERSSYDDMVSIQSSRGLHLNTSQLSAQYRQRVASSSSLSPSSPCSWKNSLEELSKGLQRICNSPSKELHSPGMPSYAKQTSVPPSEHGALKWQGSEHVLALNYSPPSCLGVQTDGKKVVRVRHEESHDTLQRRLSQISGYKISSEEDVQKPKKTHQRRPSKDLAMMVSRRLSSSHKRVNVSVDVGETDQENLTVLCKGGELVVKDLSQPSFKMDPCDKVIHSETLPQETVVNKIMCVYAGKELHIRERTKEVLKLEVSKEAAEEPFHCPIFRWNDNSGLWKMSWYLTEKFSNQNISIKTVDSKLVIVCRSKRLSMLMDHMQLSQELIRNSYSYNGVAMRYRGGIQLSLDLPEGVDARSVTAYVTDENQLVVQGRMSGNLERCLTL